MTKIIVPLRIKKKLKKIKLVLTDVDGVLTDNGRYYTSSGEEFKKFNVKDGMGINLLLRNGIKTIIVTKEKSKIVKKWSNDMNISKTIMGAVNKEEKLQQICKEFKVINSEILYIGDDVNDLNLLKLVGLSAVPKDGHAKVLQISDYVCSKKGGEGCFREIADLILIEKIPKNKAWY